MNRWLDFVLGVPLLSALSLFVKKPPQNLKPVKILIIKLAAVGDTILLIPVLRALRQSNPGLHIDWLVSPINQTIAKTVPYVNNVIVWQKSLSSLPALISTLRREKYDAVIDLEQWARGTALISFFTGAPVRAGFSTPGQKRDALYTHVFKKEFNQHEIKDFFRLTSMLFDIAEDDSLEIFETPRGMEEARRALEMAPARKSTSLRVLIHPGCGIDGAPREWPLSKYAVLINWLQKKYAAQIFLTGGPEEKKKTADLNRLIQNVATDFGGKLSWEGTISLLNDVDLVISGNTGIMHLAAALKKPQIALHGPTSDVLWGPLNSKARAVKTPCERCPSLKLGFEYHEDPMSCMNKIEVDQVKQAVESLI